MAISKITLNGVTQMDVTQKTVTENTMLNGVTSLKNDGTDITGNIQSKTSSDLTASGATVTAPAGYYGSAATKTVSSMTLPTSASASATSGYTSKTTISRSTSDQYINIPTGYNSSGAYYKVSAVENGTAGTPTATKGTVSNHAISVTPSVTNTTGYITGGTKTGTAVSVSASELVSGVIQVYQNCTDFASGRLTATTATVNGMTYSWNNGVCSVYGTASATSYHWIDSGAQNLPSGMTVGYTGYEIFKTSKTGVQMIIAFYNSSSGFVSEFITSTIRTFTVPTNAAKWRIGLVCAKNVSFTQADPAIVNLSDIHVADPIKVTNYDDAVILVV